MKKSASILLLAFALLAAGGSAQADGPLYDRVHIFGFADVYYQAVPEAYEESGFDFGQAEVDLEAPIAEGVSFEAGIAFDPAEYSFGVGTFFVDFDIFDSQGTHLAEREEGIIHTGILVGQIDVPFGIDWRYYPSPNRQLVSIPLTSEHLTEMWNDIGVQAYTEQGWMNLAGWVVNGFGYEYVLATSPAPDTLAGEMNHAGGARFGLSVIPGLELGGSGGAFLDTEGELDQLLLGTDLTWKYGPVQLKGEWIRRSVGLAADRERVMDGFYAQGLYQYRDFHGSLRYGMVDREDVGGDLLTRFSTGVGWDVYRNVQLHAEYQVNDGGESRDAFYLQCVVSF